MRRIGFEVRYLANLIKKTLDNTPTFQKRKNITGMQYFVIGYVYRNKDKDVLQKDVANMFHMQKSTTSQIINTMEKNGLIIRKDVEYDKRTKKIILTDLALAIKEDAKKEIDQLEASMVKGLSDEEIDCFYDTITKIKNNIKDAGENK